jgi:hypothetical protein
MVEAETAFAALEGVSKSALFPKTDTKMTYDRSRFGNGWCNLFLHLSSRMGRLACGNQRKLAEIRTLPIAVLINHASGRPRDMGRW